VQTCIYDLPQAGILVKQLLALLALLAHRLSIHGYHQTKLTPGELRHVTHPIQITLVVDDFGVKHMEKERAQHLLDALETEFTVSKDWTGGIYCG
jgi:hypothetical protein